MGRIGKTSALFLTLIILMSCLTLLTVNPTDAQTIPKPSVPEFTVKYVDKSYTVPETTTTDPFTGQNVTNPSHYVENKTIDIAIKNQPFTPYIDSSTGADWKITLMYQVRTKGHFAQDWTNLSFVEDGFFAASNSDYTIIPFANPFGEQLQDNAQVDFQVKAMIGYVHRTVGFMSWYFTGESSDWSNIQTLRISDGSVSSSTPNPSPTVPELTWLVIVPLLLLGLSVAVIARRYRRTSN